MRWHRELTNGDVSVAHSLLNTHTAITVGGGGQRCAGLHGAYSYPPEWPCSQADWALKVLDAETRGEVAPTVEAV